MQHLSRSHRVLATCTAAIGLAACAEGPVQPRDNSLLPTAVPSFAAAADAPAYDLGTLGGASSRATSINDSSAAVGFAFDTLGYARAFVWTPANGMRNLNVNPARIHSLAIDVNNKGQVVGYLDSVTTSHAFIWSPSGGTKYLGTLGGGSSQAYGINENGDVVGSSQTASGASHAFIWTATGGMRDLGTLGGQSCAGGHSAAYDLNDQRQVVGFSCADSLGERAFVWTETGGMTDLGTLGGFTSRAFSINNSGHVVGVAQTAQGHGHAFLWTPSGMRDLGTLGGDSSVARKINDAGEVVGESFVIGNSIHHGFLWTETGGMIKLPGLSGSGAAYGINASGQVVGWSRNLADFDRATGWGVAPAPPPPPPPPPVNHAPVAEAGGPYAGVEGSAITFSGSATDEDGDPLTFAWTFGDGATATTAGATHTYADNGTFTATLTATDSAGASHSATVTVTVTNVAPRVTGPSAGSIVSGESLGLAASFSDPGTLDGPWHTSINWGDGEITADSTSDQSAPITGTHFYFRAGSYEVRVAVTDKDGGVGTDTLALEVVRFPTTIDVAPKDGSNTVSIRSGGQSLDVALLSTASHDARLAVPGSIVITNGVGSGTRPREVRQTDVNRDGRIDLLLTFNKSEMVANGDLTTATTKLVLLTDESSGRQTKGEDLVSVKP